MSQSKRRRRPIGKSKAADISKHELKISELKHRAELSEQRQRASEAAALMELRLKQIKEAALTKNTGESEALKKEHDKEVEQLRELKRLETDKARQEIEALRREAKNQSAEVERLREEKDIQAIALLEAEQLADTNLKLKQQLEEAQQTASELKAKELKKREQEANQPARLARLINQVRSTKPVARGQVDGSDLEPEAEPDAPAEFPDALLSDDERKQVEHPDAIPIIPDEQAGKGNRMHISSLPHGISESQINDIMDDDPRYLKTVAADEINTLNNSAKTIDNDYEEFGFIVNLDKRNEDKFEHWVAVYFDTENEKVMFYYDPFGDPPTETINNGLKELVKHLDLPYYLAAEYNMKKNQNLNSNRCGVHCMQFLRGVFAGKSLDDATDRTERDAMKFQKAFI